MPKGRPSLRTESRSTAILCPKRIAVLHVQAGPTTAKVLCPPGTALLALKPFRAYGLYKTCTCQLQPYSYNPNKSLLLSSKFYTDQVIASLSPQMWTKDRFDQPLLCRLWRLQHWLSFPLLPFWMFTLSYVDCRCTEHSLEPPKNVTTCLTAYLSLVPFSSVCPLLSMPQGLVACVEDVKNFMKQKDSFLACAYPGCVLRLWHNKPHLSRTLGFSHLLFKLSMCMSVCKTCVHMWCVHVKCASAHVCVCVCVWVVLLCVEEKSFLLQTQAAVVL